MSDYFHIYYVNIETEKYTDYSTYSENGTDASVETEKHGNDFFDTSRKYAAKYLYYEDRDMFMSSFTKENVMRSLEENGSYILSYRLVMDDSPVFFNLRAMTIQSDSKHIIVGFGRTESGKTETALMNRMRQNEIIYSGVMALSGKYICIYSVDPETEEFSVYSSSESYNVLGLAGKGRDFFKVSHERCGENLIPEDVPVFRKEFVKENVMRDIREKGAYVMRYHLILSGKPTLVELKAVPVQEKGGRLIVGVSECVENSTGDHIR